MQRAILSFELPEDQNEYKMCNMSADMWDTLYDVDNFLRSRLKHADMSEDAQKLAEEVRDMIAQINLNDVN